MIPHRHAPEEKNGFALIISVSLMAFVFLLIITLITMTSVETNSQRENRLKVEAQQNALLAMYVALGELQKYAGPDQRISARADLQYGENSDSPYWTAIYGSSVEADYGSPPEDIAVALTDPAQVDQRGSSAKVLNWLVSGNETVPFNPSADVGDNGALVNFPPESDFTFSPDRDIALNGAAVALSRNIAIRDRTGSMRRGQLLVGPGTAGGEDDFVVAPLISIGRESLENNGSYSWWVGDESIKARPNLPELPTAEEPIFAFVNSTRTAVELMAAGLSPESLDDPLIGSTYSNPGAFISSATTLGGISFASPDPVAFAGILKNRYHDLSSFATSVLADSYAGGLKRDLSILLDESYTPAAGDSTADANRLFALHRGDDTGYAVPTWAHLRSFAQTRIATSGSGAFRVAPRLPAHDKDGSADDVGISPVLTYVSVGFRAAPAEIPGDGVAINMNLYPMVVLWNPYNFTIAAHEYEVGVFPTYSVQLAFQVRREGSPDDHGNPVWNWEPIWQTTETTQPGYFHFQRSLHAGIHGGTPNGTHEYTRFRVNSPDIPPGASLIFSLPLASSGDLYTAENVLENIEPEPNTYVSVPFTTIAPGEAGNSYRLVNGGHGSSFGNSGGGGIFAFLAEPGGGRAIVNEVNKVVDHDPSEPGRLWYQAHQGIGWDGTITDVMDNVSVQQYSQQLDYYDPDDGLPPSFVFLTQALFSGYGSNAQFNPGQHMYPTRWIAQGNMRAPRSHRTRRDLGFNPLFIATAGLNDVATPWQRFMSGDGPDSNRASAGRGHDWVNGAPVDAILFEFPYEDQPLTSIGQLQHANLGLVGAYPAYPIGNSLADFRLHELSAPSFPASPPGYQLARADYIQNSSELQRRQLAYYDISYLLNRSLWDRYYFSSVPASGSVPDSLSNPRHVRYEEGDLQDPDQSAAHLMLSGGFNINSTSEQAWRALLGATNQLEYNPEHPDTPTSSPLSSSFTRFARPTAGADPDDIWQGYRSLSEEQIAQLARNIVTEIRNRGPFVSVADFVNRRLVDNPDTATAGTFNQYEHLRGTLQSAIDRTHASSGGYPANNGGSPFWAGDKFAVNTSGSVSTQPAHVYNRVKLLGGDTAQSPYSGPSSFAPKYLTQGDILSVIGSSLTARSDTFVIRTYGEVTNPVSPDAVSAQAWCEAVVQRYPDYVDSEADAAWEPAGSTLNNQFGRKFKIVSFRWLTAEEI